MKTKIGPIYGIDVTTITVILMDPVGDGFPFNNNDNALANDLAANGPQQLNGNHQLQFAAFGVC